MTPYQDIYDAFLARILEDEWDREAWDQADIEADWKQLLDMAIPWFKFPRTPLERNNEGFINDLSNEEIQILANYMKAEWLNRTIMTWENVKPLYVERDFSQANLIDKLTALLNQTRATAKEMESNYYRSVNGRPFRYGRLAGKKDD